MVKQSVLLWVTGELVPEAHTSYLTHVLIFKIRISIVTVSGFTLFQNQDIYFPKAVR